VKKLSIVTISYNDLEGLKKTVDSLQCQETRADVEQIIIDGGSHDGTKEYLGKNSKLFSYWHSKPDKGIYDAMNIGLSHAGGEYVWFLNSGDSLHACSSLEKALKSVGDADILYGETMYVDSQGNSLGKRGEITSRRLPKKLVLRSMHKGMVVSHQSIILRRELCQQYDTSLRYVADFDWLTCILKRGATTKNLNCIVSNFLMGGTSAQHQKASNQERFRVMKKHFGLWTTLWIHLIKILSPKTYKNKLN
jgi:glycosyltransferase involved in cell wall biosynthesis